MAEVSIGSLTLESNQILHGVKLAYERCGNIDAPAILVCHALTGDQYSVGTTEKPGWWAGLIGPGKAVDTNLFQVITFNVLGGCNGSTGPLSVNPETEKPYRASFPLLTIRDMVRAEYAALKQLGIHHLAAVIGGSLGGMKTLEWGHLYPDFVDVIFPLAATPAYSDYGIAFNHIGIQAIEGDPDFNGGDYTDSAQLNGFKVARMAGMVTYRSGAMFNGRFARRQNGTLYDVESYLTYQGEKLAKRFDANSYVILLKAMNSHDVRREKIETEILSLSFTHDLLYPEELIVPWLKEMPKAEWQLVETEFGHDGFLVEFEKWDSHIKRKLNQLFVSQPAH